MPSWIGRGGGRSSSQPSLNIQGGAGRGSGRPGAQPTLSLNSGAGMGSGRAGAQPTLQSASGQNMTNWSGRGGGRSGVQPTLQAATGQNMTNWAGRGGGRAGAQPALKPATGENFSNWSGRGGGRSGVQPTLKPATGQNFSNWVGRGGGRSPIQPTIQSASAIALQRGLMNAASNMVAGAVGSIGGALGGFIGTPAMGRQLEDPLGAYVFALEINGMEVAHFNEVSGLKSSTEIYTIKEGGMNHAVHKLPGQSTWDNIVLKYGVTSDMSMLSLREYFLNDEYSGGGSSFDMGNLAGGFSSNTSITSVINTVSSMFKGSLDAGEMENKRFSGSIVLKNNRMQEMVRYTFQQAWIVSWSGPQLSTEGSKLAVESIEIAHHGVSVSRSYASKLPMG